MAHPDHETVVFEFSGEMPQEVADALDAMTESIARAVQELMVEHDISEECASDIMYLRGRSRWSQVKENIIIYRDKTGMPRLNVYTGDDI